MGLLLYAHARTHNQHPTRALFLLTRWPPHGIARRLRYKGRHSNCTYNHERTKHERRARHKLRVLVLDVMMHRASEQRFVAHKLGVGSVKHSTAGYSTDGGTIQTVARNIMLVVQIDVEHVEDDAEHCWPQTVAQAAHSCHHTLDHTLLVRVGMYRHECTDRRIRN
uniref:Uncharacterized protein n=1 Tax=Anopheles christyi TaxID=43041 RepID=A0A182KHS5_9DIPT